MRSVVRTMRLKPSTKNTVGGKTSRSSLTTNARRRALGMNGFLSTRDRMSGVRLELTNPTPKVLRYLHGRQSTPVNLQQRTHGFETLGDRSDSSPGRNAACRP